MVVSYEEDRIAPWFVNGTNIKDACLEFGLIWYFSFFCIYILVYFKAATLKKALSDTRGKRMNYMTNLHLLCKRNEHKYRTLLIFDGIWHNTRTKLYP